LASEHICQKNQPKLQVGKTRGREKDRKRGGNGKVKKNKCTGEPFEVKVVEVATAHCHIEKCVEDSRRKRDHYFHCKTSLVLMM